MAMSSSLPIPVHADDLSRDDHDDPDSNDCRKLSTSQYMQQSSVEINNIPKPMSSSSKHGAGRSATI